MNWKCAVTSPPQIIPMSPRSPGWSGKRRTSLRRSTRRRAASSRLCPSTAPPPIVPARSPAPPASICEPALRGALPLEEMSVTSTQSRPACCSRAIWGRICCIKRLLPRRTAAVIFSGMSIPALSGKNNRQAGNGGHRERFLVCSGQVSADREVHDEKADFSDMSSRGGAGSGFFCALWQSAAQDRSRSARWRSLARPRPMPSFRTFRKRGTTATTGAAWPHSTPFSRRTRA